MLSLNLGLWCDSPAVRFPTKTSCLIGFYKSTFKHDRNSLVFIAGDFFYYLLLVFESRKDYFGLI